MKRRNIIAEFLVCLCLLVLFGGFSVYADTVGEVNDTSVNIRQNASTESAVLAQADTGFKVKILNKVGDFYHISANGFDSAYIYSDYVDLLSANGVVSDDRVNVRMQPSTSSNVLDVLDYGKELTVVGVTGSWYAIAYNGDYAYIHKDFVGGELLASVKTISQTDLPSSTTTSAPTLDLAMMTPQAADTGNSAIAPLSTKTTFELTASVDGGMIYAVINSNNGLKLRSGPSLNAEILDILPYGEVLDVIFLDDEWTHVEFDGHIGYVSSEFVNISRGQKPERIVRTPGQEVIEYAKQFLGTPYVYGGNSLTRGVDCSGFVYQVMINFGKKLNRHSASQYNNGTPVKKADLMPGDLVFFNTGGNSSISHVGIYIGGGQFIHASSSSRSPCVTISSLNDAYYQRNYVSACRVL